MTIEELYLATCKAYDRLPNDDQMDSWQEALRHFHLDAVKAAIRAHQADTRSDDRGEVRGKWFPTPADIKWNIERAEQERSDERAKSTRFRGCGQCHDGWRYVREHAVVRCECWKDYVTRRGAA